jgi:hypothetical protein
MNNSNQTGTDNAKAAIIIIMYMGFWFFSLLFTIGEDKFTPKPFEYKTLFDIALFNIFTTYAQIVLANLFFAVVKSSVKWLGICVLLASAVLIIEPYFSVAFPIFSRFIVCLEEINFMQTHSPMSYFLASLPFMLSLIIPLIQFIEFLEQKGKARVISG